MTEKLSTNFQFFNPADDLEIYYGNLPHWRQEGVVYFVTFRLADSLPQSKLNLLREDRATWLKMNKNKKIDDFTKEDWKTYNYLFHERIEKWLEAGYGSCILKRNEVLEIVVNTLKYFEGERYILDSFVIMPNHIHIVVIPIKDHTLSKITHSWKSYSASEINKLTGKSGQLWQHESYDHIIRNQEALFQIRKYIELNPVKAGIHLSDNALKVFSTSNVSEATNVPKASLLRNNILEASLHQDVNHTEAGSFGNNIASLLRNKMHTEAGSFGNIRGNIKKNLIFIFLLLAGFLQAQNEAYYIKQINEIKFGGQTEVSVPNGRADIVNEEYAIEVEWANNWKHSIGQALWYGLQTNKNPGIVLLMKDIGDRKYGIMLQSAIDYAGISDKIKVWFYPEDFGKSFGYVPPMLIPPPEDSNNRIYTTSYTINKNSNVRHNSNCSFYNCKNCVATDATSGRGCGKCGG
jgi:REP element-mobilizing transposase RayT